VSNNNNHLIKLRLYPHKVSPISADNIKDKIHTILYAFTHNHSCFWPLYGSSFIFYHEHIASRMLQIRKTRQITRNVQGMTGVRP